MRRSGRHGRRPATQRKAERLTKHAIRQSRRNRPPASSNPVSSLSGNDRSWRIPSVPSTNRKGSNGSDASHWLGSGQTASTDQRRNVHLGRPGRRRGGDRHGKRHRAVNPPRRPFLWQLAISGGVTLDGRVGHAHSENRMIAMPKLPPQDQALEVAQPPGSST